MLGTPPAFILSQDQTLEIFYIQSFRTTYLFFRASVLLFYFFVRVLFSLWNREFLALQFTISCLLFTLYFLSLSYISIWCVVQFSRTKFSEDSSSSAPPFSRTACTLYHLSLLLSSGFLKFFWVFFNFFYFISPLTSVKTIFKSPFGRPCYITTFVPFCQPFWGKFLKIFSKCKRVIDLWKNLRYNIY